MHRSIQTIGFSTDFATSPTAIANYVNKAYLDERYADQDEVNGEAAPEEKHVFHG
jgi:hypothetical protein